MYNFTALQNASGFGDILTVSNNFSGGMLLNLFVIAVFVVIILSLSIEDLAIKISIASFVSFFISIALAYADFISMYMPLAFLIILALDMLFLYSK